MSTKLSENTRKLIAKDKRYDGFVLLDKAVPFNKLFLNKNFDIVQVHSLHGAPSNMTGFCGAFSWQDNVLIPEDGDSYDKEMDVYGYTEFSNPRVSVECGLDILVNGW